MLDARLLTPVLTGKALKRGGFYNVDDLVGAVDGCINQHNASSKPSVWPIFCGANS